MHPIEGTQLVFPVWSSPAPSPVSPAPVSPGAGGVGGSRPGNELTLREREGEEGGGGWRRSGARGRRGASCTRSGGDFGVATIVLAHQKVQSRVPGAPGCVPEPAAHKSGELAVLLTEASFASGKTWSPNPFHSAKRRQPNTFKKEKTKSFLLPPPHGWCHSPGVMVFWLSDRPIQLLLVYPCNTSTCNTVLVPSLSLPRSPPCIAELQI